MPAVLLPLVTALAFAGGSVAAYRSTPRSQYGEGTVHDVAGTALLPAAAPLVAATLRVVVAAGGWTAVAGTRPRRACGGRRSRLLPSPAGPG